MKQYWMLQKVGFKRYHDFAPFEETACFVMSGVGKWLHILIATAE